MAALVVAPNHSRRAAVATGALLVAVLPVIAGATITTTPTGTLDAVVVQAGGPRGVRAVCTDPAQLTEGHLAVTEDITGSPDLMLLPENLVDVDGPIAGSDVDRELRGVSNRDCGRLRCRRGTVHVL